MRPQAYGIVSVILLILGFTVLFPDTVIPTAWHFVPVSMLYLWAVGGWCFGRAAELQYQPDTGNQIHVRVRDLPTMWPIVGLLLLFPLNLWAAVDEEMAWTAIGYLILGIVLYLHILGVPWQRRLLFQQINMVFLSAISLMGTLLAISFPFLVAWKPQLRLFDLPFYDLFPLLPFGPDGGIHPNIMAGALVITIPLTAATWIALHRHKDKLEMVTVINHNWLVWSSIGMFSTQLLILFLSQSRGGYLATTIALFTLLSLYVPRTRYPALLMFVVIPIALRLYGQDWSLVLEQFGNDGTLGGWAGRIEIWQVSLLAIHDFSWTGIGIGTFTTVIPLLYPLSFPIESYPHAHNLFLQIALDTGVPGLISYLALAIILWVMLIVTLRQTPQNSIAYTAIMGAIASFAGMLTHGTIDAVLWGTKLSFLPWLLFALITVLYQQTQQDQVL